MKTFIRVLLCILSSTIAVTTCFAQSGAWTWMRGSNTATAPGSYGTKGVAASTNEPPGRYQACYWTDLQGDFWVFGGTISTGSNFPVSNDLWKYSVSTNMWTWVNGPNCMVSPNLAGIFGTKGIPSPNNYPSARGYGANCWTDTSGNLWLYGGSGGYNDLWKYTISTNQWTWVNGNAIASPAIFGTKGVAAAANTPGSLVEVKSAWVDNVNRLWMFGGQGTGMIDAMWRYDIASNLWTWVSGNNTTGGAGNYGTYRVEAASNLPPARASYTRWKDQNGNMYLFGGARNFSNLTLNDVWRYRPDSNKWTWVSGSSAANASGAYPPQYCKFYDNYGPNARFENQTAFSNNSCNKAFWTFGGFTGSGASSSFNDLWLFETDSFKWSWISGSSTLNNAGTFGTKGVPSSSNSPAGRGGHCIWMDNLNNVWIFGGLRGGTTGTVYANDLWRFQPDTACIDLKNLFSIRLVAPDSILCPGDTTVMNIGPHQSVVFFPNTGVKPNADTTRLSFSPASRTSYTIIVNGGSCRAVDTLLFAINVQQLILPPQKAPITTFCAGDSSIMSIGLHKQVIYSPTLAVFPNADTSLLTFKPLTATAYTVITKYRCAMDDTLRFTIRVTPVTIQQHAYPDTVLCAGDTTLMNIGVHRSVQVVPNAYLSYSPDSSVIRFFPATTTSYSVVVDAGGCVMNDTMQFTIRTIPRDTVRLTGPSRNHICLGDTIIIKVKPEWTVSVTPSTNVSYLPTGGKQIVFRPDRLTSYTVFAKDNRACVASPDSLRFTIDIDPQDQLPPFTDTVLCPGDTAIYLLPFKLSALSIYPTSYVDVSSDEMTYKFYPLYTTFYRLIGTRPGCVDLRTRWMLRFTDLC